MQIGEKNPLKCVEKTKVLNKSGLHIRPATQIVKILQRYKSSVVFTTKKSTINARNLMEIVMLALKQGHELIITAEGADANETVASLLKAFESKFERD